MLQDAALVLIGILIGLFAAAASGWAPRQAWQNFKNGFSDNPYGYD